MEDGQREEQGCQALVGHCRAAFTGGFVVDKVIPSKRVGCEGYPIPGRSTPEKVVLP
jgi:hypothetical protein